MTSHGSLIGLVLLAPCAAATTPGDPCDTTAWLRLRAADCELKEELGVRIATCFNLADPGDLIECLIEAHMEFSEGKVLAREQFEARLDLCDLLGGGVYDPEIEADDFVGEIDHPYLPFPVGGVSVRDTVMLEGKLVEDTIDWYAQDENGNVWYFGEISFAYEDGFVESIEGSWLAGVDGAKPGIVMLANPTMGTTYRQEWLLGDAEDAATALSRDATVRIGLGTFDNCVQTADFLPPEPDALENKFYALGIGFIHETQPGSTETVELIGYDGL